ncbi:carbon-nitrogen hydrolase family protein [Vibrio parahaemolyticus]|uniref:carbon-nitrogen hydrolase family protein n=1 Tax=Vibrio parahaemolyticus TaxID=670 RepID=UPI0003F9989E|nr:carbon-nitrogen hydrolase family protein [Vibrio parahaemolyticus]HCE4765494.1 carbon-nitrogen hydrolase family protein [Vibrio parahaemolyticus]HCG8346254.1 carbon-nitrogen hydrolase family protein [Vibrio parahaemolyticus]HCH1654816.1 carbon-nitrogen hydrolase family protein [Vibrio parahaemolyticus]HCH3203945.1 carbon-nitrogen hydrolase family protein [Vibrio parahaemolyticus]HCH3914901.1 carbon-nitrogen hydrolase family protein [Vibrio parahaemolyticus]
MERVGIIQMTSGPDIQANLDFIDQQCTLAANQGVKLVLTPENAVLFASREEYHQHAEPLGSGAIQERLANIAKSHQLTLVVGSMPIQTARGVTTTTLVLPPHGKCIAHYDKLHMFDVDVEDGHGSYRESDTFTAGNQIVVAETDIGSVGLSICYDVRFPELYKALRLAGADTIVVPAAFTAVTGQAHWEVLLRARAIETQCWILASGQTGTHPCGRKTWGHSMVIAPWGRIHKQLQDQVGLLVAEIDLSQTQQVRQNMPLTQHSRFQNELRRK